MWPLIVAINDYGQNYDYMTIHMTIIRTKNMITQLVYSY